VKDIMTPRTVIVAADEKSTIKNLYDKGSAKHFSRIPLFNSEKDNITGYVLKDDILLKIIEGKGEEELTTCKRRIKKVNDFTPIPDLYQILMEKREHIAIVIDKHNGLSGLVTMEDLIETILGIEIMDESDFIEDMQKFARKNWEYRARKQGLLIEDDEDKDEDE
jgi:CBS domain containing-hemolysin-like protein